MSTQNTEHLIATVKERYGRIASGESTGCCAPTCCGGSEAKTVSQELGYREGDLAEIPREADLGLGCGAPIEGLALRKGETVLDLGSGAGIDVFLAARLVGPEGRVFGIDMTPEMLARARENARKSGFTNVEFREGRLEALPMADGTVDAVTSNCVINLVPDKGAVFREIHRVLKPGGRLVISDVVLDGRLPEAIEKSVLAYVGCVSGALERKLYFELVRSAGLEGVEVLKDVDFLAAGSELPVEEVRGKVRSITFRATKPSLG
ncbi:MAG: arsenite methyltransferase [Vicinamibacteria bacterium]